MALRVPCLAYNLRKLRALAKRDLVTPVVATHTGKSAKTTKAKHAGGLERVVYLGRGARVMLTRNRWVEAGLLNGSISMRYRLNSI